MKYHLIVIFITLFSIGSSQAQTIINSLTELSDRLDDSGGDFKMTPGTYHFTTENCGDGNLFPSADILLFTGSNNIFDFTDVKFEFDSEIFAESYRSWAVQFWPVGSNNVYRNLTMEILGNETPNAGGEAIHLDGSDNLIEGFHITQRSSYPYGYGDIFGKGGGSVIGHRKRAGILVRGDRNELRNDTVLMRSYGHGIFMQGAEDALINGCYVEGELRTVSDVLAEEGTGSPADNVDFLTVWGFNLRDIESNNKFSLQEDGIRSYTTGGIYGTEESRPTTGTQVKNCTVVQMRSGVTIGWDYTDKVVDNCTVLACETGYWFGSNTTATNCKGDASLGPLVSEDVGRSNSTMDVTLLDNYVPKIGNTPHLFFAGNGHNLTLHDGTTTFDEDIVLQVGGKRIAHRWLEGSSEAPLEKTGSNLTFTNNTMYPVVLESNVSNSDVFSCSEITDNGSGNDVSTLASCSYERECNNIADNLEAECYDDAAASVVVESLGDNNDRALGTIRNGDWISFNRIDLTFVSAIKAIAGTNKDGTSIEIREGSVDGTLMGILPINNTGDFFDYQETTTVDLVTSLTGEKDLYFVFTGEEGYLFNLDKINFVVDPCTEVSFNPVLPIGVEDFCEGVGVSLEELAYYNQVVSDVSEGDYIKFSNVEFGYDDTYNSIRILASSDTYGGTVEVRTGSLNGELLGTINVTNTGGADVYKTFNTFINENLEGTHDLYFVFSGTGESIMRIDNINIVYDQCAGRSFEAYERLEAEDFCEMSGVDIYDNEYIGNIQAGDWIRFSDVDFTLSGPQSVTISVAGFSDNGFVDVRLDSPGDVNTIATTAVSSTNGWTNWQEITIDITEDITGIHDVYVFFRESGNNMNWLEFNADPNADACDFSTHDAYSEIEAEDFCEMSGVEVYDDAYLGNIQSGDWAKFGNVDFNGKQPGNVVISYATQTVDQTMYVRVDNPFNGEIIATITVPGTGGWTNFTDISADINTSTDLTGTHDIYLTYEGGINTNWFEFEENIITHTSNASDETTFSFYPNPTTGIIHLSQSTSYTVINTFGQVLITGNDSSIDLSTYPKGVYTILFNRVSQKIIKQ